MTTFYQLIQQGYIGFYNSCRVTLISQFDKISTSNTLVFARFFFREQPIELSQPRIKLLKTKGNIGYAVSEYDISNECAQDVYEHLSDEGIWKDPLNLQLIIEGKLRHFEAKYTSPYAGFRENRFLAPFPTGSYWLEFFNEAKQTVRQSYNDYREHMEETMIATINDTYGINLAHAGDRIGNIIFQFPVNLLQVQVNGTDDGRKIELQFAWHQQIASPPPCDITIESREENTITGYAVAPYYGEKSQIVPVNRFDTSLYTRLFRKDTRMLLLEWKCDCAAPTNIIGSFTLDQPVIRTFRVDETDHQVELYFPNEAFNPLDYREHAKLAIARINRIIPYRQFEQGQEDEAHEYIRYLIRENRSREMLIIDPYLSVADLLRTAFFSTQFGRKIRAIGSANPPYYKSPGSPAAVADINVMMTKAQQRIVAQRHLFSQLQSNNTGIDLEFRYDFGDTGIGELHDRFLLFPGLAGENQPPKAISIGTSYNAVGKSSHVIGAFEYPQGIIDEFERKWQLLRDPKHLIGHIFQGNSTLPLKNKKADR